MTEIKINKPYSELTDDEISNICLSKACYECPLHNTKYCVEYIEVPEDKICECTILPNLLTLNERKDIL